MNKKLIFLLLLLLPMLSCVFHSKVKEIEAKPVFSASATTGEGSIWNSDRHTLFWVDIEGKTLFEFFPNVDTCAVWKLDKMITTVVPETDSTVVLALQDEIVRINLNTSSLTHIADIPVRNGLMRTNDGKCDPAGRLWVGTMGFETQKGIASLYTVTADGVVAKKLSNVTISNGLVWTSDKRFMFYNDTPTGRIARFRYNAERGEILYDGIAITLPKNSGSPDGMTIDSKNNLWVAQWGGFGVYCYNPYTGELITKINVPAPHVASCAFGGENLDVLYITTARAGLSEAQLKQYPLSGSLFSCRPGVKGVTANKFGHQQ